MITGNFKRFAIDSQHITEDISYQNFIRSGFRAELVPSSRKINAERRALMKKEIQVSEFLYYNFCFASVENQRWEHYLSPFKTKFNSPLTPQSVVIWHLILVAIWFSHFYDLFFIVFLTRSFRPLLS